MIASILDFAERVLEHRILSAVNDFIDRHSGGFIDAIKPFIIWFVHTPFVLLTATVCGILIHAYIKSQRRPEHHQSSVLPTESSQLTQGHATPSLKEDGFATVANPVLNANPTVAANPVLNANPLIEIHNHPQQPRSAVVKETRVESQNHNVKLEGVRQIWTPDLEQEQFDEDDGQIAVVACFLNQSIAGKKIIDFDYVRARVVFRDANGIRVADTSKPKWLNHQTADVVNLEVNRTEYLLLAVYGNDDVWALPYLAPAPSGYWDDGSRGLMVDARPLPFGDFNVEITLVSEETVGVEPFAVRLSFKANGSVKITTD